MIATPTPYILNKETLKIELHFEKSEYLNLTDEEKTELKHAFVWGRNSGCWISRAAEPNLYRAQKTAEKLGFTGKEIHGERLSFAEMQDRKIEKAEHRAERYDEYAENAAGRAANLQKEREYHRGDISFWTQPNTGGSAGRAFANYRQKIVDRYERGFKEYKKSEYFQERAATARITAGAIKMNSKLYLDTHIKEQKKTIKKLLENCARYEKTLQRIEGGETLKKYDGSICAAAECQEWLDDTMERIEAEIDKQGYYENALDELGGLEFSKANIKPGYIVQIRGDRGYQIVKANPTTVDARVMDGGAAGMILNYPYSAIQRVVRAEEIKSKEETEPHPYHAGQILAADVHGGGRLYKAYQIIKATAKTVELREIMLDDNGQPQRDVFKEGTDPIRKKPTVSRWSNQWNVYDGNWPLYPVKEA